MFFILYLPILLAFIGLLIGAYFARFEEDEDFLGTLSGALTGLWYGIVVAGGIFLIFGVAIIICTGQRTKWEPGDRWEMVSVADTRGTSGSFFLGIGSVNSTSYYVYYIKTGNNSYVQRQVATWRATIVEDAPAGTGYLQEIEDTSVGWGFWNYDFKDDPIYELHVPPGTIIQHFNLDLN